MFPFFSLARELRDLIYAHLLTEQTVQLRDSVRLHAAPVAPPDLLLVSPQFAHELGALAAERARLTVSAEPFAGIWPKGASPFPPPARRIRRVRLLIACCHSSVADADADAAWSALERAELEWWTRLADQLRAARCWSVHLHLRRRAEAADYERARRWSERWTTLAPALAELCVWKVTEGGFPWNIEEAKKVLLMRWDCETKVFWNEVNAIETVDENEGGARERSSLDSYAFLSYG